MPNSEDVPERIDNSEFLVFIRKLTGATTDKELANKCGVSPGKIGDLKKGRFRPTLSVIRRIADRYPRVTLEQLNAAAGGASGRVAEVAEVAEEYDFGLRPLTFAEAVRVLQVKRQFFAGWATKKMGHPVGRTLGQVLPERIIRLYLTEVSLPHHAMQKKEAKAAKTAGPEHRKHKAGVA